LRCFHGHPHNNNPGKDVSMRPLVLACSVVAALACAAGAQAQQCGPLKRALSLDLRPGPQGGPLFGVAVTVNGTPRVFQLNTAGQISRVSPAIVSELKLSPRSQGQMFARNGAVRNGAVVTVDLGVGNQVLKDNEMLVMQGSGPFDGIYAPDLMQHYDIEMDFAGRKLNYFLTDHCDGQVVYWPNAGITSVPIRGWTEHASYPIMTIPVAVDGHPMMATVETGDPGTTMEADTAHQLFDLTADSPGAVPLGTMNGNASQRVYGYTFKTLTIGGVTINAPRVRVEPDLLGRGTSDTIMADSRVVRHTDNKVPALRLGMNVLGRLHLYIAAKEQKLYLTQGADQGTGAGAAARP
jgi:hypothetical protein